MISDADTLRVEVVVLGEKPETYTAYCVEEFLKDEIPCSYACHGENSGKIRHIRQIRAHNAAWQEISADSAVWKTIQYGARHKLGHGRGLCAECKKIGIAPGTPPTAQQRIRRETSS